MTSNTHTTDTLTLHRNFVVKHMPELNGVELKTLLHMLIHAASENGELVYTQPVKFIQQELKVTRSPLMRARRRLAAFGHLKLLQQGGSPRRSIWAVHQIPVIAVATNEQAGA